MTPREAAEDLRDAAAILVAALIARRFEDAMYILNALVRDSVIDLERAFVPMDRSDAPNRR